MHDPMTACGTPKRAQDLALRKDNDPTNAWFEQLGRLIRNVTRGRGQRLADHLCATGRRSAPLRAQATRAALCLSASLFATGCVPILATKGESVSQKPNPMFNAAYSEDADVPFVAEAKPAIARGSGLDRFRSESASRRTREMADWVISSKDNRNMPFAIIDKVNAKVYVFSAKGDFYGSAPVLLGLAKGDHSMPGIGKMPLSRIPVSERTTPAGRFVTAMGRDHKGKDTLWLDYEGALSMHAVVKGAPKDRRAERLESPSPLDNRISFGCINVPVPFFEKVITPKFSDAAGVIYILPETKQFGKS